ncbi:uncharacterized protein [Chironomus tepperi]|uniref:uncharacterized protein n=1 Tax=Chironomus tepperi TaxID=113505 RepID=UPI00391F07F5
MEYNKEYIISYTKTEYENLNENQKLRCRVLKFTSEWTFVDLISEISYIYNKKQYKNLFVFIVECDDEITDKSDRFDVLESILIKFNKNRPLVLVLSSKNGNDSRVYYKNENQKLEIQPDVDNFDNCLPFFKFIKSDNAKNLQLKFLEKLPQIPGSSLILRLLRIFNFPENFYKELIQKCAIKGSVDDIVAALNIWLDNVEESMTNEAVKCLTEVSYIAQSDNVSPDDVNNINSHETETSILYLAVKNSKKDIVDFLTNHCMEWIQQLPYDHQLMISTTAFNTNQLDVVCKLLDCDYPFPNKLDVDAVTDINLKTIINARTNFHSAIKADDKKSVEIFIKSNPRLKFGFNTNNCTALYHALCCKKFEILYFLQSNGYGGVEFDDANEKLSDENDKEASTKAANNQRRDNAETSLPIESRNILLLETCSFILNKNISNPTKREYSNKIRSWYNDIYNTRFGSKLIDVAAQCNNLKIIFDFEDESTYFSDLGSKSSLGVTYPKLKWIFIGAKSSKVLNRDQKIKGVISHEICHFVMGLVYQNNDSPFFEYDSVRSKEFEDIVEEYNEWKVKNDEESQGDDEEDGESQVDDDEDGESQGDDEEDGESQVDDDEDGESQENDDKDCNAIISTVYTMYDAQDHIAELIVRGPHIQAQFDNKIKKVEQMEKKYKKLFDFMDNYVIPDLESFNLENREKIQQLNRTFRFLKEIKSLDYKLLEPKNLNIENDVTIISTNVPHLLFTNIYSYIEKKDAKLLNSKNIFVPSNFNSFEDILKDYKEILSQNSKLNVFVDCTEGMDVNVKKVVAKNNTNKFIFLIKNDNHYNKISNYLTSKDVKHNRVKIDFSWNDLTVETQQKLLETKINFQGNSAMTLNQLISIGDFTQVFDDQQLNLLLEKSEMSINLKFVTLDDNFKALFTPRQLIKKQLNSKESERPKNLSQKDLIKDIEGKKFILISDNAGTGKSWTMKNIANDLSNSNRWISYVDLKHFLKEFKSYANVPDLKDFMTNCVLKSLNQFEIRMFLNLYKNGKVSILFDAFDEIAPDFASFMLVMTNSIKEHAGIQLLITSRDLFEADLSTKLNIDTIYKLEPLTQSELINMLAVKLKLCDLRPDEQKKTQNCHNKAYKLVKKILRNRNRLIGSPQFFKMIADVYEEFKDDVFVITYLTIYGKFVSIQYTRWSNRKGGLRKEDNVHFQQLMMNFFDLHKYFALNSYFPNQKSFSNLELEDDDSNRRCCDEQIISCGFIIKIGDSYLFTHETFREYFVAVFFIDILKQNRSKLITNDFCQNFIYFLTGQQFQVIRMFLNEGFDDASISKIVNKHLSKFAEPFFKKVGNIKNLAELFEENCLNLEIFIMILFKDKKRKPEILELISQSNKGQVNVMHLCMSDKEKMEIVWKLFEKHNSVPKLCNLFTQKSLNNEITPLLVASFNKDTDFHMLLWKVLLEAFKIKEELKQLLDIKIQDGNNFIQNLVIWNTAEVIEFTLQKFEENLNDSDYQEILRSKGHYGRNLLHLAAVESKEVKTNQTLWQIFRDSCNSDDEFLEILREADDDGSNVFHLVTVFSTGEIFQFMITELNSFASREEIRKLLRSLGFMSRNLLQSPVANECLELHETLWKILEIYFDSSEILLFIKHFDDLGHNLLLNIIVKNTKEIKELTWNKVKKMINSNGYEDTKSEVIEYTLQKIKEILNDSDCQEILRSKGQQGRNLLHRAAVSSKEVKTHQTLWQIFRNSCNSDDKFLEILQEVDDDGSNILNLVTTFSTGEIFQFMIIELNSFASREEIRKWLRSLGYANRNLLQSAAQQNTCLELHEILWEALEKYFDASEILQFIKHRDDFGCNMLLNVINKNTKEIKELTWNKVKKVLNSNGFEDAKCDEIMKKNLKLIDLSKEEKAILSLEWIQITNSVELFEDRIQVFNNRTIDVTSLKELELFMADYKIENHQILWENLIENCKSKEKLKNLFLDKDQNGNNYIHLLVIWNTAEVIEFTLQKIKENLIDSHYQEMLRSRGFCIRNLLHRAAVSSKEVKTHQTLWQIFRNSCNSDDKFLEILREVDDNSDNVFHLVAIFSTGEIFQFMITELNSLASREEIRKWLRSLGFASRNLLQSAAHHNTCLELHETLWEILEIHFDSSEILQFIKHLDNYGCNVLLNVIDKNTKEIKELTWNKVKKVLNSNGFEDNKCDEIMKKDLKFEELSKEEKAILSLEWISIANSVELFEDRIKTEMVTITFIFL